MPTNITFDRVKKYLAAIADNPNDVLSVDSSPHLRFWNVPYQQFINGNVPGGNLTQCHDAPTPIINKANPAQSPFFLILTDPAGFCGMPRMPEGGPFITDEGYQVTLADGTTVSGKQIRDDILDWLTNGYPEGGAIT